MLERGRCLKCPPAMTPFMMDECLPRMSGLGARGEYERAAAVASSAAAAAAVAAFPPLEIRRTEERKWTGD